MKLIFNNSKRIFFLLTMVIAISGCDSITDNDSKDGNDPLNDLPWLKAKVDELTLSIRENSKLTVAIYQCTYDNGKTGFLFDGGNIRPFHNFNGDLLCIMGGFIGETCPELKIDLENKKLIWMVENGFVNSICKFDNPLMDLLWLKEMIDEGSVWGNEIYQCTYRDGTGFLMAGSSMQRFYRCTGQLICV